MQVIRNVSQMREFSALSRAGGKTIGLVPTMGCLHRGHLSLVTRAHQEANSTVVSIFVNPVQFGVGEDFEKYPRTEAADLAACEAAGVDAVFLPTAAEMFPQDFSTFVNEEQCAKGLCGEFRPGHFRGVATVVHMLFNIVAPDVAVFGQKDAQQVAVLRKMVRDLFLPVKISVAPIAREADGLALSSRNRYLTSAERRDAPQLHAALLAGKSVARSGVAAPEVLAAVAAHLGCFPAFCPQYIVLADAVTMAPVETVGELGAGKHLLAVAAYLGATRLIDNEVF
ncbi:MAG: pantoate--beta-alanine ligase [Puniceicoccales bacterium]|jgi:pantoate--beta-alanine ligase|nr:pantoate--beta-alanine ligase [Puniceicoccales bacterium]